MYQRLASRIREQLSALIDQYDQRLCRVPGYTDLPEAARRDLEQRVLLLIADCLEVNDASRLIEFIHERAEQVLAYGFQPEWFQQAVAVPQEIITPLVESVDESNFVWRSLGHAQAAAWEIVARERRRVELTLRESEARYQTIFDSTPVMFWLKDAQNRTLRINKAAAELEGVKPSDVEGISAYDLYPREQAEAFYQDDLEVIRTNRPKLGIVEQHTSVGTGKLMWLETGKTPVHNDQGEVIGVLAFAVDVTERKQVEEILRRSAEQQQQISRRLRAALEAASELIQTQDLDALYRRTVELAREKLEIERCGLYMIDETGSSLWGTYGTDDQRRTTDEREAQRSAEDFATILAASPEQLWIVHESPHVYVDAGEQHTVGSGWVVATVLRGATGPIGILFNDSALSGRPIDEAQQEALAIYCSIIGSIIERKQLEEQVQNSLSRRSAQMETTTDVAQEIASATDLTELFKRVVTLIKQRFNYYHAQLFRYEPAQDAVVLITGYGEIGQKMLEAGHRLQMGRGVVGTAALAAKSILATDVQQDTDWRPNPHLPQTRGELAVPIKWRDQVLGILDVQSDRAGALTHDDRLLLEGLCSQIAIAIESKRLLDAVQQSERLMRTLIDAVPDYIYAKDLQGRFVLGNAALARLYGLATPAEMLGKTDFDFYPRELAEQYRASESPVLLEGINLLAHEEPNIGTDGRPHWHSTTKVPWRDEQAHIIGLVGITSDITERKQTEIDLRKFKLGLDRSTAAIFITDPDGIITYANPAFEKIYGFTPAETIGQTPRLLKSGLIPQEQYQYFWQTLLSGQTVAGEIVNKTKDGRLIPIEGSNSAIQDENGKLIGFLALHNDITERKLAEQRMEETLRETERLYAAVSHENWQAYRQTGSVGAGYLFDQALIRPADDLWAPEIAQALTQQTLIASQSGPRAVAVAPLAVRGETIGALGVYDDPAHPLSKEELQLLEAVSDQVALALESARLFDQTQRDAEREHTINRITSRIRNARSVDEVLAIAAQELRLATRASRSVVEITPGADQAAPDGNGANKSPSDKAEPHSART
jgi:PAS domain S-box-containing protein